VQITLVSGELGLAFRITSTTSYYSVILNTATNSTVLYATAGGTRFTLGSAAWPNTTVWTNTPISVDVVFSNTGVVVKLPGMNRTINSPDVRISSGRCEAKYFLECCMFVRLSRSLACFWV
jgi:hypothetical protein